ncbi:MAG: alanine racemase [Clostridium sp.]
MINGIRPVWAEVDLDCIKNNIKEVRKKVLDKEIIAVVKADAYGHGAVDVAPVLLENGADSLAVAVITEALELRQSGIESKIIILGYTPVSMGKEVIENDFEQTVYSYEYAYEINNIAKELGKTAKVQIKIDTGMGRLGFLPNDKNIEEVIKISKLSNVKITGIFTHFATADEFDKSYCNEQAEKYKKFIDKLDENNIDYGIKHLGNSATILDLDEYYYDGVRPGIILYGYYPSNEVKKEYLNLKPALTLKSKVVHIKALEDGSYISYGRAYKTQGQKIIATLPIGYADGYTRALFNKAKVIINGELAPVVGKICMDQCMIDISHINNVEIEDEVILIGEDGNVKFNADDLAEAINTINYEVICMIGKRVPRVYIENDEIVKTRNYL